MDVYAPQRPGDAGAEIGRKQRVAWIRVAKAAPYFVDDSETTWTPVGHNEAITWPNLEGLRNRRDVAGVDNQLRELAGHGVTCLRLMLEYAQEPAGYLEHPAGRFVPEVVQQWDDVFHLCRKHGIRLLLTPFDTFWMWVRWRRHPYNRSNGAPLDHPSRLLI